MNNDISVKNLMKLENDVSNKLQDYKNLAKQITVAKQDNKTPLQEALLSNNFINKAIQLQEEDDIIERLGDLTNFEITDDQALPYADDRGTLMPLSMSEEWDYSDKAGKKMKNFHAKGIGYDVEIRDNPSKDYITDIKLPNLNDALSVTKFYIYNLKHDIPDWKKNMKQSVTE